MQPRPLEMAYSSHCFGDDIRAQALAEDAVGWVEVFVEREELGTTAAIRRTLDRGHAAVWSLHAPFGSGCDLSAMDRATREAALGYHRQAAAMAAELGARILVAHGGAEPVLAGERTQRLGYSREGVTALAAECRSRGLRLAVEFLPRSCPGHNTQELLEILQDSGEVAGVCLDVNHANLGQDLVANVEALGQRVYTVHMSDDDGVDERHWLPGQGIIDWPALVAALRRVGYAGPFVYESSRDRHGRAVTPALLQDNYRQLIAPLLAKE